MNLNPLCHNPMQYEHTWVISISCTWNYFTPPTTCERSRLQSPLMRTAPVLLLLSGNDGGCWGHQGENAVCSSFTAAAFPHNTLHHQHSSTFAWTRHDLMDDPTEDSLVNGIIMVLRFDPHVIQCIIAFLLIQQMFWGKKLVDVSHTGKYPAYTGYSHFRRLS